MARPCLIKVKRFRLIHPAEGRKSTVAIRVIPKYRIYEARIKSEEWQRRPTQECLGVK
nr:MAG TPA: hypothetical protein [Caudoviricetes sp.]